MPWGIKFIQSTDMNPCHHSGWAQPRFACNYQFCIQSIFFVAWAAVILLPQPLFVPCIARPLSTTLYFGVGLQCYQSLWLPPMTHSLPTVVAYKCPLQGCESWHPNLSAIKQHINRRASESDSAHMIPHPESLAGLQRANCSQKGPRSTYLPIETAELPVADDTFRTQSLFAQRSLFGVTVPTVATSDMQSYFPSANSPALKSIRKEVFQFLEYIRTQSCQEWSSSIRNIMADHGFKPIQPTSYQKYASTLCAFVYFCQHCPWDGRPTRASVSAIMWAAFAEPITAIRMLYMVEKFFCYSYHCMGRGPKSRDLRFIVADCAYLKYGLRGGFLSHVLTTLKNSDILGMNKAALPFKNPGAFQQLNTLKNIAFSCIPAADHQPISWTPNTSYSSLTVTTCGVLLTHAILRSAFNRLLVFISSVLDSYGVPELSYSNFVKIRDSQTSTHAGEGLVLFNPHLFPDAEAWQTNMLQKMDHSARSHFFTDAYAVGNHIVAGCHLSAGPGFRGTEDASLLLVNSLSQAPRNLRAIGCGDHVQIVLIPDYSKARPLSSQQPTLVAKSLPVALALLVVRYIFFMKRLEGVLSTEVKNCSTYLLSHRGQPVAAEGYNNILNDVFHSIGLGMSIHDLRHALEAFARHLQPLQSDAGLSSNREMANHSRRTSASYARDDFTVATIDADVLARNEIASYEWNMQILGHSNRLTDLYGAEQLPHCRELEPSNHQQPIKKQRLQLSLDSQDPPEIRDARCFWQKDPPLPLSLLQQSCKDFLHDIHDDALVVIPTASGKTRLITTFGAGVVIVISPFKKLGMQLLAVLGEGAYAWPLHECSEASVFANAKYIVVAIEHCVYNSQFVQFMQRLHADVGVSRLVVDEVHHLLQATHPDYRPCLSQFWSFRSRLPTIGIHAQLVGLTATLRQSDIPNLRRLLTGIANPMPIFRRSSFRDSITFELFWSNDDVTAKISCATASLGLAKCGKTIVFGTSLLSVQTLSVLMNCQALTSGVDLDVPQFELKNLLAASSCAGHGLDLKDITAVSVLGVPFDIETLLQWAGRIRVSGTVRIYLNQVHVVALSKSPDRRGELAKMFLNQQKYGINLQMACCRVLESNFELGGQSEISQTPQTQCHHALQQLPRCAKPTVLAASFDADSAMLNTDVCLTFNTASIVNLKLKMLAFIAGIPTAKCRVCYILGDQISTSCGAVCSRFSRTCFRCFQKHSYKDCKSPRFKLPGNSLCQRCFLPFGNACVGPNMHPGPIGSNCTSPACEVLPQAIFCLFHNKSPLIPPNCSANFSLFVQWLIHEDETTRLPGVLSILKALLP